jgi:hypothetical protein
LKKILKIVNRRGSEPVVEVVLGADGNPRRFTKKSAFSYVRSHGDRNRIEVEDGGDRWVAVINP